jgi:hypothetical protein
LKRIERLLRKKRGEKRRIETKNNSNKGHEEKQLMIRDKENKLQQQ